MQIITAAAAAATEAEMRVIVGSKVDERGEREEGEREAERGVAAAD